MSLMSKGGFTSLFSISVNCIPFPFLNALSRTSNIMLNRTEKSKHASHAPDLKGKKNSVFILNILAVGFHRLRNFLLF